MTPTPTDHHDVDAYAVRIRGRLEPRWSAWFDEFDVSSSEDGTTTIRGAVLDQAALHGLLRKVRDVGLPILSVTQLAAGQPDAPASATTSSTTSSTTSEGH